MKFHMIQNRSAAGGFLSPGGMDAFFLPGRQPRGFLLAWEKERPENRELSWRLSEQLQWEYNGIREEGLLDSDAEEYALVSGRLREGALLSIDRTSYCFYRRGHYQLYFGEKESLLPLLPQKEASHDLLASPDLCRGRATNAGFYVLAPEGLERQLLPERFRHFCRLPAEVQFQLAEYLAALSEKGLPAAIFYWN